MSRPDPIEYAEHLYASIRAANFSTLSFLAFGNAVKDGVDLRRMPRIAAEPFMRVVGEMLDLEEEAGNDEIIEADLLQDPGTAANELATAPEGPGIAHAPAAATPAELPIAEPAAPTGDRNGNER